MHDYQRQRVMMLLDPETDPLGAGYHIIQSKIAIGSGGLRGKGWLHGTQSQLEFLPERHTDFIFAVLAEELGLIGVLILLALYILLIMRGLWIAAQAQTTFGRVMAGGLMLILFVYVFVNIGMVSGILPVVGVPLPLVSYGGSALIVLMAGFGIVMSIHTHRKNVVEKRLKGLAMRKQWLGICIAAGLLAACSSDDVQQKRSVLHSRPSVMARRLRSAAPIRNMKRRTPRRIRIMQRDGKSYKIVQDPANFTQAGFAAIYDAEPNSNLTASGEAFDPTQLTAAHPSAADPELRADH